MRLNHKNELGKHSDVFLNGRQVQYPFEADEEKGEIIAGYHDVNGSLVLEKDAESGALIYENVQVIRLKGQVEIKPDWDRIRQICSQETIDYLLSDDAYTPLTLTIKE